MVRKDEDAVIDLDVNMLSRSMSTDALWISVTIVFSQ